MSYFEISSELLRDEWDVVVTIFEEAGWGDRGGVDRVREAFAASKYRAFAYENGKLLGFGRVISDGIFYATICDLVVRRDGQRRGVGRALMQSLQARTEHLKFVSLISVPGKETFYEKLGFRRLRTGMLLPKTESQKTQCFPLEK